ncbi:MAG: hypothetical protein FWD52_07960 [Candidatus Bathyarchaeota archaeon]|nr:hypothetical protein [Candidatus Termiticorpusculum sp.]
MSYRYRHKKRLPTGKTLIIILLTIALLTAMAYIITEGFQTISSINSKTIRINAQLYHSVDVGRDSYGFVYYPDRTRNGQVINPGHIQVTKLGEQYYSEWGKSYPLTKNTEQEYLGMKFTIKETTNSHAKITVKPA